LIAGLLLAMQGTARAEWQVHSVDGGTPSDVEVWTPDLYSVSTEQGAWLLARDGGTRVQLTYSASPPSVGTVYYPATDCFASFWQDGRVTASPANCAPQVNILYDPHQLFRVKHTQDAGAAYASGITSSQEVQFVYGQRGSYGPSPWALLQPFPVNTPESRALGVLSMANGNHALFGDSSGNLHWYLESQPQGRFPSNAGVPQGIDLFPGDGGLTALVGMSTGLLRAPLTAGGVSFSTMQLPGGPGSVTSVDVNTGAGGSYGDGFGMALVERDGGTVVLQAVPATRPEEIGTVWKVNSRQPMLSAPPQQVECRGAELCVVTLNRQNTQNVAIYRNDYEPVIDAGPETSLPEASSLALFVGVTDADGDPLRIIVERPEEQMQPDGGPPPLRIATSEQDGGILFQLTSAPVCEDQLVSVLIRAADGLRSHERRKPVNFRVVHERPAAPALNLPSNRLIVQAGGDAGTILVNEPVGARCRIDRYEWQGLSNNADRLETNGRIAVFPTPPVLCEQNGRSYFYRVHAIDEGGTVSAPTDFSVQVRPWGVPSAPFGADAGVGIDAGQSVTLSPTAEHLCQTAQGYPGVDTLWELTEGTLPIENVQLTTEDGGLVTGPRAVTPRLSLQTQECADAQLTFSVRHFSRDGSGLAGPASTFKVRVDPSWSPLSTGTLTLEPDLEKITARTVVGTSDVKGINCLDQRGGVKARIRLQRLDGTVVQEGEFTAPGPWGFTLDSTCEPPTTYNVVGELVNVSGAGTEPGGARGGEGSLSAQALAEIPVVVPSGALPLEPLYEPRITARCGEPASGTLQQRLPSGPCQALSLVWEQVGGPPLTQTTFSGQRIEVATRETDFGALIGQSVVLRVSAGTVGLQREHSVPITAEPFVEVSRRTERAAGASTELLGVSVELRNTTGCGVREVSHMERLEGVDYVPGSARFNGAPVEAELEGSELTVRGLVLEGDASGVLTYVVRPRLLGSQRFEGHSSLRGIAISQPPEAPASGCGCSGGGSGAVAMGLVGLLAALSRRRRR
jgi:uncharacterized protein (TIGR03382 family)